MGKRKSNDSGENQIKKHKKMGSKDGGHMKQNKKFVHKDKSQPKDNRNNKRFKNKKNEKTKDASVTVRKPQTMQEILSEKLRKIQESKAAEKTVKEDGVSKNIPDKTDTPSEVSNETSTAPDSHKAPRNSKSVDKSSKVSNEEIDKENTTKDGDNGEEEEDPEKAAIREKKREKRKQKKLQKEEMKQQDKERTGTAKMSAIEYLNHWKDKREDWKFTKVRQVWLLHNMYDQDLLSDEHFETLLSYLEGLKGKSREVTVTEAEQIIEKADSEENDEPSAKMMERAKQIIQLLSY